MFEQRREEKGRLVEEIDSILSVPVQNNFSGRAEQIWFFVQKKQLSQKMRWYKGKGDTCTNRKWYTYLPGSDSVCLPVGSRKVVVVAWSRILGDGRRIRGCMFKICVEEGGTDFGGVVISIGVGNQSYVVSKRSTERHLQESLSQK